jgi:hypothetical protein
VNVGRIETDDPPEFKETDRGLKLPVNVALTGRGFVPPIGIPNPL